MNDRESFTIAACKAIDNFPALIERFASRLQAQQRARIKSEYPEASADFFRTHADVTIKVGLKYTKVDIGTSGRYMVENRTGAIYGIKAYGVIHRGHYYGTLATIDEWDWSGYTAVKGRWQGFKVGPPLT